MREDAGAPREIAVKSITRAVTLSMGRMWRSVRYATDSGKMPRKCGMRRKWADDYKFRAFRDRIDLV